MKRKLNTIKTGENIEKMLAERGMTQKELAVELEVSDAAVSHWVNGEMLPKVDRLINMADLFGCAIEDILIAS